MRREKKQKIEVENEKISSARKSQPKERRPNKRHASEKLGGLILNTRHTTKVEK